MDHPKLLIYDDGRGVFGPITDLRSIVHVRTGIVSNRRRIERRLGRPADALAVPAHLAAITRDAEPSAAVNLDRYDGAWIAVNARWTGEGDPPPGALHELPGRDVPDLLADPPDAEGPTVLARSWHLIDRLEANLADDAAAWTGPRVAPTARVHPSAILDESQGPVILDEHAVVEALAVLQGPIYIGPHSIVKPHTNLRPHTALGEYCRVGGEVSSALVGSFSNKAHHGFLGQAVVGRWVNLGADTNCSNLKNTYSPVRVHLVKGRPPEDSGRTFLGPVIGDHVKTAIGTRVNTGAVLGTGSIVVLAGRFTPAHVPPLTFLTDAGARPFDVEKLLATARLVTARRGRTLGDAEARLLRDLATRAD